MTTPTLPVLLKRIRKRLELTQAGLGELFGLSQQMIAAVESGRRNIGPGSWSRVLATEQLTEPERGQLAVALPQQYAQAA